MRRILTKPKKLIKLYNTINEFESSKLFYESNSNFQKGNLEEAIFLSKKAISLCDKKSKFSENLYQFLSFLYTNKNDLNNSLIISNEGLKHFPNSIQIKIIQGNVFFRMKHYQTALRVFESIEELDSETKSLQFMFGMIYFHLKKYAKSIDAFLKSLEVEPFEQNLLCNFYLSQCYFAIGDKKTAEKYLNIAKSIDSEMVSKILKENQ
eukprot:gene4539-7916_t